MIHYVDTGALYRAVGSMRYAETLKLPMLRVLFQLLTDSPLQRFIDGTQHVYIGDEDVSVDIRLPEASMAASNVSKISKCGHSYLTFSEILPQKIIVMDGRDIAPLFFLMHKLKYF